MDGEKMKKKIFLIILLLIIISTCLSGCLETESTKVEERKKVTLESSVVALKDSDLIFHKDGNRIIRVEAKYLFRNLVNDDINLVVTVEFYDKNDNLLATGGPKYINLIPLYSEQKYLGANSIEYSEENAELVDHIVIVAEERT